MKDLSDKIIRSIENRAVRPVPHWQYTTKKILFWGVVFLLVLFGALALALAIYLFQSIDWNMYSVLGYGNMYVFMLTAFPYGFILLLSAFLILACYFYRRTPKGHKINLPTLATVLIVFGLVVAFAFHIVGINREAYFQLARMPFYHQMMFTKETEWSQPDRGLLWGEVSNVGGSNFSLRDISGKDWNVTYDNNTSFDSNIYAAQGQDVKIVGQKNGVNTFQAKQVQKWDGVINCNGQRNMMRGINGGGGMMGGRDIMNWK